MTYQDKAKEYNSKCVFSDCRECESVRMFASFLDAQDQEHKEECVKHMVPCGVSNCSLCDYAKSIKPQPVCEHEWGKHLRLCEKCDKVQTCPKPTVPVVEELKELKDKWRTGMFHKINELVRAVNRLTSTGIKE